MLICRKISFSFRYLQVKPNLKNRRVLALAWAKRVTTNRDRRRNLDGKQPPVEASVGMQFFRLAHFSDHPVREDCHAVSQIGSGQPVSDDDDSAAASDLADCVAVLSDGVTP